MEIDFTVEKDDIVERYGDTRHAHVLAGVCREPMFIPLGSSCSASDTSHSCSSSDFYPSMRALILLEMDIMEVSASTPSRDLTI